MPAPASWCEPATHLWGRVQSGHWHFDLRTTKDYYKIVFEPRLGPAKSAKRLPLVGGRKTRPLTVWVGLIRKQGSPSNERPHTPWVYSEHPQTEHATLVVLASILLA